MNRFFYHIVLIQTFMFAIATSVFADEACDDAIADGKAAYNSGNYATAQKHFENVVKWCGGSYGAASSWIQNCKNKQAEIKRAQEKKKQEQKNREQQAQLERKGYMEVTDIKFANVKYDNTVIDNVGEKLYSDKLRYLKPVVYYNGLSDEYKTVEYDYKIYYLGGITSSGGNAREIYKTDSGHSINVKPYNNQNSWLLGYGSDDGGTYDAGLYLFELLHKGYKLYEKSFKVYENPNILTDCQGHTYPVVKIGNQYWMAENLQCTKYDTQSERAGATLSTSNSSTDAPYYTDGRNTTTKYSGNLTSYQRKKLGLLYNWAAAVGLATESEAKSRTTAFSGRRQGICPNGWHIPTDAEWGALGNALGGTEEKNGNIPKVGKKLKATSGWHGGGNGTNDYSFAALPAGGALRSSVDRVGAIVEFWTATPRDVGLAYLRFLGCDDIYRYVGCNDDDLSSCSVSKNCARSVRCIRN